MMPLFAVIETPPMRKSLKRPKEVENSKEDKLAARELPSLDDNYDSPSNEDTRDGENTSSSEEEMPSAKFRRGNNLCLFIPPYKTPVIYSCLIEFPRRRTTIRLGIGIEQRR